MDIAQSPEGRRIFSRMTVMENLQMGAAVIGNAHFDEDLDRVFKMFPRMKERIHQRGGTLSGGEQQMLAIARALMSRPRLLLLDEPSLGLAPLVVKQIFEIIADLNERTGLTVLLVEQNAFHALRLADRGYVMVNGEITMSGTGRELLDTARNPRRLSRRRPQGGGIDGACSTSSRTCSTKQDSFFVFMLVTIILGGGAAFLTGRAIAGPGGPGGRSRLYMLVSAAAVRFFHMRAVRGATLLSLHRLRRWIPRFCLLFGFWGFRVTRAGQMAEQYGWLYRRAGLLSWVRKRPRAKRRSAEIRLTLRPLCR